MDHINTQRRKREYVAVTPATILVGEGAALDSLLLLNFLVSTEERLAEEHGLRIDLVDLVADAGEAESPLKSIATLTEHLVSMAGVQ